MKITHGGIEMRRVQNNDDANSVVVESPTGPAERYSESASQRSSFASSSARAAGRRAASAAAFFASRA